MTNLKTRLRAPALLFQPYLAEPRGEPIRGWTFMPSQGRDRVEIIGPLLDYETDAYAQKVIDHAVVGTTVYRTNEWASAGNEELESNVRGLAFAAVSIVMLADRIASAWHCKERTSALRV
jgi:hypothetical protein